jgi:hypothetical protein
MEHNGQAVLHSQNGILEMLSKMVELLGEVCSVTRRLLRRGLGLQTSRLVNVFFPAKGWILFEQPTYTLQQGSASQDKSDIRGLVKKCGVPCAAVAVSLLQQHQLNSFHEDNQ